MTATGARQEKSQSPSSEAVRPPFARARNAVRSLALAIGLLAAVVAFATPDWAVGQAPARSWSQGVSRPTPVDGQAMLLYGIAAAYALAFGACVGSFLNVVVYRLPAGLNLMHPGSRCPVCMTPISLVDNVPILSWLRLRGRCRVCAVSIPPRYLFVEATVALLFLLLMQVEIVSGGANIPFRKPLVMSGLISLHWPDLAELLRLMLYHAWLLTTLLAAALIRHDRQPVPRSLYVTGLVVALVASVAFPDVRTPPPNWLKLDVPIGLDAREAAWQTLLGGLVGAALGFVTSLAANDPPADWRRRMRSTVLACAMSGAFLGWQAALSVALIAMIALLVAELLAIPLSRAGGANLPALIGLASLLQIVFWRRLEDLPHWPGIQVDYDNHAVAVVVIVALAALTRLLSTIRQSRQDRLARLQYEAAPTAASPTPES